jgi:hypothetical protein
MSYDTSGPGGFYWGPLYGFLAAPVNVVGFAAYDNAARAEAAAGLATQIAASLVSCCEAGRVAYPDRCPWHGADNQVSDSPQPRASRRRRNLSRSNS